jgi:hypothetical protein
VDGTGVPEQVDRPLQQHADRPRREEQPGEPGAQPHDLLVAVPRRRVPGDRADHEADERPADQARGGHEDRVDAAPDDAGQEERQRLLGLAAAAARREPDEDPADADADDRVDDVLDGGALDQPDQQRRDRDAARGEQREPEVLRGQPQDREDEAGHAGLQHPAAAAEGLRHLTAYDGLDRVDGGRGVLGLGHAGSAHGMSS